MWTFKQIYKQIQTDLVRHTPEKSTWFSATPEDGEVKNTVDDSSLSTPTAANLTFPDISKHSE